MTSTARIAVRNTTKLAVEEETTEGVYVAPTASTSYVQTLDSGLDIKPAKALLERKIFTGTIGKVTPRTGERSVTGAVPTECRTNSVEGSAPEFNSLINSAMGSQRQNTTVITTKATGNTGSTLQLLDADIVKVEVGDIVLIKEAGAFHVSPIISKTTGTGSGSITLLVPKPAGSFSNSVTIAKFTTYTVAESGHKSLSLTKYVDDAICEKAIGCRINKLELQNFATGKIPNFNFGFEGLNFDRLLESPAYTATFDSALPPIVLDGRAYMDGTAIVVNDIALSMENTAGFSTSISSPNGKVASRIVSRKITGSLNPYQMTNNIDNFTKFVTNTEFSLFAYAKNDSGVAGEFQNVVAVYLPKCLITQVGEADAQGLVQQTLTYQASRGADGLTNEIYMTFI
jgi:hypothetical protein